MIPVLILSYNHKELTQRCVASVRLQDVHCEPVIMENGSTDGAKEWIASEGIQSIDSPTNLGISAGWNKGLEILFNRCRYKQVIVLNNDVVLPPWFARELASHNAPLVSGFDVTTMEEMQPLPPAPLVPYPDFSAYMMSKACWDAVGKFDERLFNYCSDCDFHLRAHRAGLDLWKANTQYYHERSSTIVLASEQEKAWMEQRADDDRRIFKSIYGCEPGTKEYLALVGLV